LRIHFADGDIARTRLKLETDLMWEIVSSVHVLQHADGGLFFDPWRRRVRERMSGDGALRAAAHILMTVAPNAAYFPDFLTPAIDTSDIDVSVDAVLSTQPRRLREEVGWLEPSGAGAGWLDDLARGKSAALRQLRQALRVYFGTLIEPYLPVLDVGLNTARAEGIQHYLRAGPEGLLRRLGPATRWEPPVLTVDYPVDRDLFLAGRGLVPIPCFFSLHRPVALADSQLRPVLVFPIRPEARLLAAERRRGDHLSALLGSTRAAILRSVTSGSSTTALARKVDVAPATVSHHTSVLREAGLLMTERHENFATHLITPLGLKVLTSGDLGAS
jgi:DNA-binding transcriptional ArsR family regulator